MRDLASAIVTARTQRTVVERKFLWVTARNRDTGAAVSRGFWNGDSNVTVTVLDGRTGTEVARDFVGVGLALSIGAIPLLSDITIRNVTIELPLLDDVVNLLVRDYDVRSAPMQVYSGIFNVDTRNLVAAPTPSFVGYVDGSPIETPKEGEEGSITLDCVSTTRELTRTNSEVRSHESQILRNAVDTFYKDTAVVNDWDIAWGTNRGSQA